MSKDLNLIIKWKQEQKKNSIILSEINRKLKSLNYLEDLKENLKQLDKKQNKQMVKFYSYDSFDNDKRLTLYLLSDIHFRNENDYYVLKSVFSIINKDTSKEITIAFMGDEIDGLLHANSIKNNIGAINSAIEVATKISEYVNELSKTKKINLIFVKYSNHGQTRPNVMPKRDEAMEEDLGIVIEVIVKQSTINNNSVKWIKNENDKIDGVFKWGKLFFLHGHQGFASDDLRLDHYMKRYSGNDNLIFMGHFHKFKINDDMKSGMLVKLPAIKSWQSPNEITAGYELDPSFLRCEINGWVDFRKIKLPQEDRRKNR